MSDLITAKAWKRYLAWIATENRKIKRRNDKAMAKYKKDADEFHKTQSDLNVRIEQVNRENREKFRKQCEAWDAQPWYKRVFGDDRPWLRPIPIPTHSTIYLAFPIMQPEKEPSIEEFLTWQTTSITKTTARSTPVTRN